MADAVFRVVKVGPQISIQDGGRTGLMRFGVPASGAMDKKALIIANHALGRDAASPVIEISRGGLVLQCLEGSVTLALAGGGFLADIDDRPFGSWQILTITAGQTLTVKVGPWGSWTYLAFLGSLDAPQWLNSRSTHSQSGFGGGALKEGMTVTIREPLVRPEWDRELPCPILQRPRHLMHIVYGPQDRFFPPDALDSLVTSAFLLTDSYDRMGVRLAGPSLKPQASRLSQHSIGSRVARLDPSVWRRHSRRVAV